MWRAGNEYRNAAYMRSVINAKGSNASADISTLYSLRNVKRSTSTPQLLFIARARIWFARQLK